MHTHITTHTHHYHEVEVTVVYLLDSAEHVKGLKVKFSIHAKTHTHTLGRDLEPGTMVPV